MIKSFADKETRNVWKRTYSKKLPEDIQERGRQKLFQIHHAEEINDLRVPPGNRLEKLSGDREGQWSICVNRQWRISFEWHDGDAYNVEIEDYH